MNSRPPEPHSGALPNYATPRRFRAAGNPISRALRGTPSLFQSASRCALGSRFTDPARVEYPARSQARYSRDPYRSRDSLARKVAWLGRKLRHAPMCAHNEETTMSPILSDPASSYLNFPSLSSLSGPILYTIHLFSRLSYLNGLKSSKGSSGIFERYVGTNS